MRQRVVIAIALACEPQILIADEPTTALDVTIQAQILDLLRELQEKIGTSVILITHDLGVVASVADRVAVMYAGKIVETGTVREAFYDPQMPYTWGLLASIPLPNADRKPGPYPDTRFPAGHVRPAEGLSLCGEVHLRYAGLPHGVSRVHRLLRRAQSGLLAAPSHGAQRRASRAGPGCTVTEQSPNGDGRAILEVKDLKKHFKVGRRAFLKAVDGVSLEIQKGETLGLVGESGCGKTTVGRVLVRLYEPSAGAVLFAGEDVHSTEGDEGKVLNRKMQMIFQDPQASLNPRMVVSDIIAEGIDIHHLANSPQERLDRVHELLETVGLSKEHANRFPHEFSGGQRQRIGVARALAVEPEFIVADEPVSALDVSIQAQVINLMKRLQRERDLTYLFISHDLSVVKYISDRVGVMYLGQLVELTDSDELYANPLHPYTRALLSAVPIPDPDYESERERTGHRGRPPKPGKPAERVPLQDPLPAGRRGLRRT